MRKGTMQIINGKPTTQDLKIKMFTDFYNNELKIGDNIIYVPSKPHKSISIGVINDIHYYKYSINSEEYYLAAITIKDSSTKKERKISNIRGEQLIKLEYFKEMLNNEFHV